MSSAIDPIPFAHVHPYFSSLWHLGLTMTMLPDQDSKFSQTFFTALKRHQHKMKSQSLLPGIDRLVVAQKNNLVRAHCIVFLMIVYLVSAHGRVEGAEKELEMSRAADLHERQELVHVNGCVCLRSVSHVVGHPRDVISRVHAHRNRDSLAGGRQTRRRRRQEAAAASCCGAVDAAAGALLLLIRHRRRRNHRYYHHRRYHR